MQWHEKKNCKLYLSKQIKVFDLQNKVRFLPKLFIQFISPFLTKHCFLTDFFFNYSQDLTIFKQIIDSRSMCTGPCPCTLKSCARAPQTRALQPSAKAYCLGLPGPPRLHCTACTALHGLRAVSESERILTYRRSPISEREFSELHCTVLQAENCCNSQPITDYFSGRPGFSSLPSILGDLPFLLSSQIPNHYEEFC